MKTTKSKILAKNKVAIEEKNKEKRNIIDKKKVREVKGREKRC